jgi:CrcB protein
MPFRATRAAPRLGARPARARNTRPPRRPHLAPVSVGLVAAGGSLGAAAREAVAQALPAPASGFPVSTLAVNLSGAFLLGVLLEAIARAGDDRGRRRRARLLAGTGFMGAYTTYSTFAVESDQLLRAGRVGTAVAYVAATVAGGLIVTAAGITLAAWRSRVAADLPVDPDVDGEPA